nr:MAG TPA: hypothetical protein [Caudoviricetes sp.]
MAASKFKLDRTTGTGTGNIKITPIESANSDSYREIYQIKTGDKIISNVDLKLLRVPKDKYVPTSDDGLVYNMNQVSTLGYLLEHLDNRDSIVPYNEPISVLHPIPSEDPEYLNKVGNLIYIWEYRTNKWLSLNSVRKKLNIGADEDFILNTAYYGGIMLYFSAPEYQLPDKLLKDDGTIGNVMVNGGDNFIIWPNIYTQNDNTTTKPYHVRIKLKDNTPINGYIGGYNYCRYVKKYTEPGKPNSFDFYYNLDNEKKKINRLYTYFSNSHITVSLQEDQLSIFNFFIFQNSIYTANKTKVGNKVMNIQPDDHSADNMAVVLKGLNGYTIPKVPIELGFKEFVSVNKPNPWPGWDDDEEG